MLVLLSGPIGFLDSSEFTEEVQSVAVTSTVKLVNPNDDSEGSGVVVKVTRPFVYILTANHLVGDAESLEVQTFSRDSYPKVHHTYPSAKVIARGKTGDLAILRLTTHDELSAIQICPVSQLPPEPAFAGLGVGCSSGSAPTCKLVAVSGKKLVRKKKGEAGTLVWESKENLVEGRSGGPLVDARGYLIGMASGTSGGKGYYCHPEELHRFLRLNRLKWLAEEPTEPPAKPAAPDR
jgi:S1-C subfamily serine protease